MKDGVPDNVVPGLNDYTRIDADALKEVSDWLAGRISTVRLLCYETVIEAAFCTNAVDRSLNDLQRRVETGIAETRRALEKDMFDRYGALNVNICGGYEQKRVETLAAMQAFEEQLRTVVKGAEGGAPNEQDVLKLKNVCLEEMQPSTTGFLTCLFQLAANKQTDDMIEKQKYVLSSISGIEQVASRINLIAINAAIEAARSGEAGSAFSVIAHEIQDLARRAKEATEEITRRINA